MNLHTKTNALAVPLQNRGDEIFYPESDGNPIAETDTHRELIQEIIQCLKRFFSNRKNVYVTGNIMFYYVEGAPNEVVSPDAMVCFGVPKGERTSYKSWEENDVAPSVIFEIASRGTWHNDRVEKRLLYEQLGVREYFIFNPLYPKSLPAFLAFRLEDGELETVKIENGTVRSEVLGLDIVDTGKTLRLLNTATNEFLKTTEELAAENAALKAEIERLKSLLENR